MRRFLSPTWLWRYPLVVVLVVAFAYLGRWQWHRAMAPTGDIQNLLYAVEWWTFAALVVGGLARLIYDELREAHAAAPEPPPVEAAPLPSFAMSGPAARPVARAAARPRRDPLPADPVAEAVSETELADYNAYLAWLNANPRR